MTQQITIKRNDRRPYIEASFTNPDGQPLNLTTATSITFTMSPQGTDTTPLINAQPAIITNATQGLAEYRWAAGNTATAGKFYAEFTITWPDGSTETHPTSGYLLVHITRDLT